MARNKKMVRAPSRKSESTLPVAAHPLRILMIAPQPWFQPRGTPFSVLHRIKALTTLGHRVDLATYPIGQDVPMPGLRILRTATVPLVRSVRIGPSAAKVLLDLYLYRHALRLARAGGYDLLHTHEEASFFGVGLSRRFGLPHLYDMHSSLPQQLENFKFSRSRLIHGFFSTLEKRTIEQASALITICPELQSYVETHFPGKTSLLIENVADNSLVFPPAEQRAGPLRQRYGLTGFKVILYYGTLEAYQGIPLLIDSAAMVVKEAGVPVRFLLVGGHPEQVRRCRALAGEKGLGDYFVMTGNMPPQVIPAFISLADVLVSPRISGTNSPLKIYSYLRSGVPVVATRHITHTQVLDESVAILAEPSPEAFADGIVQVLRHPRKAAALAQAAAALAEEKYSYRDYLVKTQRIVEQAAGIIVSPRGGGAMPGW